MAKLTDIQKDEGNGSFVKFVITTTVCKDPWGRLVRKDPWGRLVWEPKIPPNIKQIISTKIVHTSGTLFENVRTNVQKYI